MEFKQNRSFQVHSFYKNLFYKNMSPEKCPKFKNILRTCRGPRKGKECLFCLLHKVIEIICFSANVVSATSPILLFAYLILLLNHFYLFLYFSLADQGSSKSILRICASSFVLSEWKITNAYPTLIIFI